MPPRLPLLSACSLAALACTPTAPGDPIGDSPYANTTSPNEIATNTTTSPPVISDALAALTRTIIIAEYDVLEARFSPEAMSYEEYVMNVDFIGAYDGRLPGLIRAAAPVAGIREAEVNQALASDEWQSFINHLRTSSDSAVSRRSHEISTRAHHLPRSHQIEGGCERRQAHIDAHVAGCKGITMFRSVVGPRRTYGCPDLRYDAKAYAHACSAAGHAWADTYLEYIERDERIEAAKRRMYDEREAKP